MFPIPLLAVAVADSAPEPATPIEAEAAFYRTAQVEGQWTAFRKFAAEDAVIFTPQPARAQKVLPKADPPIAVQWWAAESYVSCDGTMAVNTGPWARHDGSGYFTTVWELQRDGRWKWTVDGGDDLATPRALPDKPSVRRAACKIPRGKKVSVTFADEPGERGGGVSKDGTLAWTWHVAPDGARRFVARIWNGKTFETVVRNTVAAPKSQ